MENTYNHYYNTQQGELILKEYGRNIQKIVEYIKTLADKDERTRLANSLIELMRLINPNTRDSQDYQNKLWDDLYIMSRFSLDVDSPYPMPEVDILGKKPHLLTYSTNNLKYKHYGKNVELLVEKALKIEDPEDKYFAIVQIGKLMKSFYITWNRDNIQDSLILHHIEVISGKKLDSVISDRVLAENAFELSFKEKQKNNNTNVVNGNNKSYNNKSAGNKNSNFKNSNNKNSGSKSSTNKNSNNKFKKKKR